MVFGADSGSDDSDSDMDGFIGSVDAAYGCGEPRGMASAGWHPRAGIRGRVSADFVHLGDIASVGDGTPMADESKRRAGGALRHRWKDG